MARQHADTAIKTSTRI